VLVDLALLPVDDVVGGLRHPLMGTMAERSDRFNLGGFFSREVQPEP
jgi:hypothetical protein